jgi:LAS superfamily LD-carboxypeptidase LdcB
MAFALSARQLTGRDDSHLVILPNGHRLNEEAAAAFMALKEDALEAGFDLSIASSYRSYRRQLQIWNGKASGLRPVYDDRGQLLSIEELSDAQSLRAIMRFSAIPGSSRHHWGTDLDVYDALSLPEGYDLQLSPEEVAPGGMFDALHNWLDERMKKGRSHGFFRPYSEDRGGVATERWHLSYAPVSIECESAFDLNVLRNAWDCEASVEGGGEELLLRAELERQLPEIFERYCAVPDNWHG